MKECWRLVPSLPDVMASSIGRLMRIPYQQEMPYGGMRWYGGEPTTGVWEGVQCRYIYPYKGRTFRVARLICEAFHGPAPTGKNVCMHLDENAANNIYTNLRWGTQKENLNAPKFLAYLKTRNYDDSEKAKTRARMMAA